MKPAWVTVEELDSETVARISYSLGPFLHETHVDNSACISGLVLDAAEVFQMLHFSFDDVYWDDRDFPSTVHHFVTDLISELREEPRWINERYSTSRESLKAFLHRRHFGAWK
jgi:hypothetical protein